MNNNIKFEIAKEIMARKIAIACEKGFDPQNEEIKNLLEEEKQMNKFDAEIIDKIINIYGNEINKNKISKNVKTLNPQQMGE